MAFGPAFGVFMFLVGLLGLTLTGIIVLTYAAYSLLVVVVNTAAGSDEIGWTGEPLFQNFPLLIFLGWILLVWAVPADILLQNFAGNLVPDWGTRICLIVA